MEGRRLPRLPSNDLARRVKLLVSILLLANRLIFRRRALSSQIKAVWRAVKKACARNPLLLSVQTWKHLIKFSQLVFHAWHLHQHALGTILNHRLLGPGQLGFFFGLPQSVVVARDSFSIVPRLARVSKRELIMENVVVDCRCLAWPRHHRRPLRRLLLGDRFNKHL